jgi:hypothetical protein
LSGFIDSAVSRVALLKPLIWYQKFICHNKKIFSVNPMYYISSLVVLNNIVDILVVFYFGFRAGRFLFNLCCSIIAKSPLAVLEMRVCWK